MHASIAAGLLLLAQLAGVAAHGYLITPKARSYGPSDAFYDDMSGNGAGLNVVFNSNPGICGDPFQGVPTTNFAGTIGPIQATYNVGATISVTFQLTANHGGKIVMKLCPSSPASATQSCFNTYLLKRSDTGTTEYWITTGTYTGSAAVTLNYVLPAGVSCANGCLLQWEYVAMQSCIENCASAVCGPAYSTKYNPITGGTNMVACPVAKGPEIFRNCADIKITGTGPTSGPAPSPTPQKTPAPTKTTGTTCQSGGACGAGPKCKCPTGQCCSQYNYCGITTAHCGTGCQASWGSCGTTTPVATCPAGGSCGATPNCKCPSGQCCSQYNYCGTTSAHCGTGCQKTWGTCL